MDSLTHEVTSLRLTALTGALGVSGDCEDPNDRAQCTTVLRAALAEAEDIDRAKLTPDEARPRLESVRAKIAAVAAHGAVGAANVGKVVDEIEREIEAAHLPEGRKRSGRGADPLRQLASGEIDLEAAKRRGINVY